MNNDGLGEINVHRRSMTIWIDQIRKKSNKGSVDASARIQASLWIAYLEAISSRDLRRLETLTCPNIRGRFWGGLIAKDCPVEWCSRHFLATYRSWIGSDPTHINVDFDMERMFAGSDQLAMDGIIRSDVPGSILPFFGFEQSTESIHRVDTRALFFIRFNQERIACIDGYFDVNRSISPSI